MTALASRLPPSLRPYFEPAPLAALLLGISSGFPYAMIGATLTTRLAQDGIVPLAEAWALVSRNPARAAGLGDRGDIAVGQRADLLLVDDSRPGAPRVVATLVAGEPRHVTRHLVVH